MRIEGRVEGDFYVVAHAGTLRKIPLAEARGDTKLAAAIKRNGWQGIPDG